QRYHKVVASSASTRTPAKVQFMLTYQFMLHVKTQLIVAPLSCVASERHLRSVLFSTAVREVSLLLRCAPPHRRRHRWRRRWHHRSKIVETDRAGRAPRLACHCSWLERRGSAQCRASKR